MALVNQPQSLLTTALEKQGLTLAEQDQNERSKAQAIVREDEERRCQDKWTRQF